MDRQIGKAGWRNWLDDLDNFSIWKPDKKAIQRNHKSGVLKIDLNYSKIEY